MQFMVSCDSIRQVNTNRWLAFYLVRIELISKLILTQMSSL